MYLHTCMCTYIHILTYIYPCMHKYILLCTYIIIHKHTYTYAYIHKAMLIKESVLRPEIFKKNTEKKTRDNIRMNVLCNDMYCHTYLHITKFR